MPHRRIVSDGQTDDYSSIPVDLVQYFIIGDINLNSRTVLVVASLIFDLHSDVDFSWLIIRTVCDTRS